MKILVIGLLFLILVVGCGTAPNQSNEINPEPTSIAEEDIEYVWDIYRVYFECQNSILSSDSSDLEAFMNESRRDGYGFKKEWIQLRDGCVLAISNRN